jgi:hypothetical protein
LLELTGRAFTTFSNPFIGGKLQSLSGVSIMDRSLTPHSVANLVSSQASIRFCYLIVCSYDICLPLFASGVTDALLWWRRTYRKTSLSPFQICVVNQKITIEMK